MSVTIGSVATFPGAACDRAQAVKVLEEAAEVFEAVDEYRDTDDPELAELVVDECADVVQAVCNLLAGLGVVDMTVPMAACEYRNRKRGRM